MPRARKPVNQDAESQALYGNMDRAALDVAERVHKRVVAGLERGIEVAEAILNDPGAKPSEQLAAAKFFADTADIKGDLVSLRASKAQAKANQGGSKKGAISSLAELMTQYSRDDVKAAWDEARGKTPPEDEETAPAEEATAEETEAAEGIDLGSLGGI